MKSNEIITELFDNDPIPFEWEEQNDNIWKGTFYVNDIEFTFMAYKTPEWYYYPNAPMEHFSMWEVGFGPSSNIMDPTIFGTGGKQYKIFTTVIKCTKEFIDSVQPEYFQVSSLKSQDNRVSLYNKMQKYFESQLTSKGYEKIEAPIVDHPLAGLIERWAFKKK